MIRYRPFFDPGDQPHFLVAYLILRRLQRVGNKPVFVVAWSSSPEAEDTLLAPDTGIDDFVLKSTTSEGTGLLAAALLGGLR